MHIKMLSWLSLGSFHRGFQRRLGSTALLVALLFSHTLPALATNITFDFREEPTAVTITPATATVLVDAEVDLTAFAIYEASDGDVTEDELTAWGSSNEAVATVAVGVVTALSAGTTTITAEYGGHEGTSVITVVEVLPGGGGGGGGSGDSEIDPVDEEDDEDAPSSGSSSDSGVSDDEEDETQETEGTEESTEEDVSLQGEAISPLDPPPPGSEEFYENPEGEIPDSLDLTPGSEDDDNPEDPESNIQFQYIAPAPGDEEFQLETGGVFLPDELSVTRGEALSFLMDELELERIYSDILTDCYNNLEDCLSLFLSASQFSGVVLDAPDKVENASIQRNRLAFEQGSEFAGGTFFDIFPKAFAASRIFNLGSTQLYPDVPPHAPFSYEINIATMLSMVQGYYGEPESPFKPYQVISRIEALKIILGSLNTVEWVPYSELEVFLGGVNEIKAQNTVFSDVDAQKDYAWWYPRYINTACELEIMPCRTGSKFRPNEYVTEEDFEDMVRLLAIALEEKGFIADMEGDDDDDNLKNYIERSVYLTDPQNKDTDGDELTDYEEIKTYKTSPLLRDSDADGLNDSEETKIYLTDPLNADSDGDDYSDYLEILAGTSPKDRESFPQDDNENGVADAWEEKYDIEIRDGTADFDQDGLSDKLEYQMRTDPINPDTDGDEFTDGEEVLQFYTDPLDPSDPGTLNNIGVRITNFIENQLVSDTTPIVKGIAPAGAEVRVMLRNDYGYEKLLGVTTVDDRNMFLFQTETPIRDGRYFLAVRALIPGERKVITSPGVHIIINSSLNVIPPRPKQLADQVITEDVLVNNIRLRVRENRPVLVGETDFGNRVTATWRSLVTTSALIADAASGEFEIQSPVDLEPGNHEVYITATRKKDGAQSETVKILFSVTPASGMTAEELRAAAEEEALKNTGAFGTLTAFAEQQGGAFWLLIAVLVIGVLATLFYFSTRKRDILRDEDDTGENNNGA